MFGLAWCIDSDRPESENLVAEPGNRQTSWYLNASFLVHRDLVVAIGASAPVGRLMKHSVRWMSIDLLAAVVVADVRVYN